MKEMLDEINYASYTSFASKHDDAADLISQLIMMEIQYPMPSRSRDDALEKVDPMKNSVFYRSRKKAKTKKSAYSSYV